MHPGQQLYMKKLKLNPKSLQEFFIVKEMNLLYDNYFEKLREVFSEF